MDVNKIGFTRKLGRVRIMGPCIFWILLSTFGVWYAVDATSGFLLFIRVVSSFMLILSASDLARRLWAIKNLVELEKSLTGQERFELQDEALKSGIISKKIWKTQEKRKSKDDIVHPGSILESRSNASNGKKPKIPNLYDALIAVEGCGPKTAQKIISKIYGRQILTKREMEFLMLSGHDTLQKD